jgi:hypothetical protein
VWMLVALVRVVTTGATTTGPGRTLIAASSGLLFAALATSIKGAILDQAPANAYFWLFAGLAIGARSWAARPALSPVEEAQHQSIRPSLEPVGIGLASVRPERAR